MVMICQYNGTALPANTIALAYACQALVENKLHVIKNNDDNNLGSASFCWQFCHNKKFTLLTNCLYVVIIYRFLPRKCNGLPCFMFFKTYRFTSLFFIISGNFSLNIGN
jgi:hypothetical protein